jgi:catechol 2,3-dioxygenase-like lactoylglutathione lyase family enzyme
MPITVERVDFLSVPTRDMERARTFYVETLGLLLERDTPAGIEVTAGQVTLGVWEPEKMGRPLRAGAEPRGAARARRGGRSLRPRGSGDRERRSTRASATWPSSAIPTATP